MEVTHVKDHVTNASIGYSKVEEMGIDNSPEFFHILSSSLYQYQTLAMVREVLSNAADAHTDAGNPQPIEVTVTSESVSFKDFGSGISPELIKPVYGTYGSGTKRNNENAIGGFGLGCKSPFAYTDNFEVTSCYQGTKTIYRMSKASKAGNGKPSIITMLSVPCGEETGITVTIPIEEKDQYSITQMIKGYAYYGEFEVMLNGELCETMGMSMEPYSYKFTEFRSSYLSPLSNISNKSMLVRYANILYPLPEPTSDSPSQYRVLFDRLKTFLNKFNEQPYVYANFIVQAPANSLSVQPSREGLTETEYTYAGLMDTLQKVYDDLNAKVNKAVKSKLPVILKKASELNLDDLGNCSWFSELAYVCGSAEDTYHPVALIDNYVQNMPLTCSETNVIYKEVIKRTQQVMGLSKDFTYMLQKEFNSISDQHTRFRNDLASSHYYDASGFLVKWYRKLLTPLINPKRLYVYSHGFITRQGLCNKKVYDVYTLSDFHLKHPHYLTVFRNRPVILTTNLRKTSERVSSYNSHYTDIPNLHGALVYHVPTGKKNIEIARYALEQSGYAVYDFTVQLPWEKDYNLSTKKSVSSTPALPRVSSNVAKDSIPALSSIITESGNINTLLSCRSDAVRVSKPISNLLIYINKNTSTTTVDMYGNDFIKEVAKYYGDQIGIVGTVTQKNKWDEVGNKSLYLLMMDLVVTKFKAIKKEYIKYTSTSDDCMGKVCNSLSNNAWRTKRFMDSLQHNSDLLPYKKYPKSKELTEFLHLYNAVLDEVGYYRQGDKEVVYNTLKELIPDPVPSAAMTKFIKQVRKYPALAMIDLDEAESLNEPEAASLAKHVISQIRKIKV